MFKVQYPNKFNRNITHITCDLPSGGFSKLALSCPTVPLSCPTVPLSCPTVPLSCPTVPLSCPTAPLPSPTVAYSTGIAG